MYDVAIIGAGIIGAAIARELARYDLKIIVLEKDSDVANGTTKANSAIVHAGFDPKPDTLKAKLNVEGAKMFPELCRQLDVPFKMIGSLVIAFCEEEMETLQQLYEQGCSYGIDGLEIVGRQKLHSMEEKLSETAVGALYAKTAGITDPYLLAIALAESSAVNGATVKLNSTVSAIQKNESGYQITCGDTSFSAQQVINASGLYADRINAMVNPSDFEIKPFRGEYFLLDKGTGRYANHVLFPCPTALGKGVLISPTVHGNLIIGPNSEQAETREATQTTIEGLAYIKTNADKIKKDLPYHQVITSFSGLRAKTDYGDFIISESPESPGFINVAGIESPGLAASPAIARYVAGILKDIRGGLKQNTDFRQKARKHAPFMELDEESKQQLIGEDPRYGRIVCRCESITEGEIVRAIAGPVGATTVDGIKKRTRPGGGRCQGGFCGPRVMQIIARELNRKLPEVNKDNPGSYILTKPTKNVEDNRMPAGYSVKDFDRIPDRTPEKKDYHDLIVIGGGPAGMAAAVSAYQNGIKDILVIERDRELGGILQQCIHNGFGLHHFREELTGPEYAEKYIEKLKINGISYKLDTMVLSVGTDRTITYINSTDGLTAAKAGAVILAMGCRERTRGAINIPGTRPAGIFSAGTAQRYVNIEGYLVGRKVVVFGSGDIGLIMARRMVLEGAEVIAVIERKDYSDGLIRNQVQCLDDFNIPLLLRHTIVNIRGKDRVEGITIAQTDSNKQPIAGSFRDLECDTILFSRGLIPENELSKTAGIELHPATGGPVVNEAMETSVSGIFACGNVVHVHDLVDWVTEESIRAGKGAAAYIEDKQKQKAAAVKTIPGNGIKYIVPQLVRPQYLDDSIELFMRVSGQHENVSLLIKADNSLIKAIKKKVLTPGEMVSIKLKNTDLPDEQFKELIVELAGEDS